MTTGYDVRLLSRNPARAKQSIGGLARWVEVVAGSVRDRDGVDTTVRGCSDLHISLNGAPHPPGPEEVEHRGTALVAAAGARCDVELLSCVASRLVHPDHCANIPEHATKLGAERAIQVSGVPFLTLRPTYVVDTPSRHVQGRLPVVIGRPPPVHMAAAAPRTCCTLTPPGSRVVVISTRVQSSVNRLLHDRLHPALDVIALLEGCGEPGDPTEADQLLGAPSATVDLRSRPVAGARRL